jgi:hypothetical protein
MNLKHTLIARQRMRRRRVLAPPLNAQYIKPMVEGYVKLV